ncbi:hypothetical protein SLEP1_g46284 [Rubroshorea leprosula]|uniref:Uncharacterized protein n=1 Tax=Rubroshorea leprosula TaxID=152421 RepID=A0AAV5LMG5_9ROSI|nr:hypothetical protein SLEP1_g46284 [Rubroshorea leprosula]
MQTETIKYSIQVFDGKNNFALWQSTVKDVLTCQGLDAALEETKPAKMKDSDWMGKTTLVMKDVTSMLLENDKFLREDDGANQTNALVMEHSRGRSNGRGGHKQYKCPKFKEDFSNMKILMKSQETKGKGEANIVEKNVVEVLACEECDLEVEQNNQRCILNSAATTHVCNNPSEFVSLVQGELGKTTVASSEKVDIEGIGVCSSQCSEWESQDSQECEIKQEWCKVYKGGRLVLRERKNKHNIYVLEQHLERRLNKTMRKMVWKPKGI